MIVSIMLGLAPFTPPNGMPTKYVQDMDPAAPYQAPPIHQSANEKESARKRYYEAFKALRWRATAEILARQMDIDRSTAQKWLSRYKGVLVRHYGKVGLSKTNAQIVWEWIRDDE